MQTSGGVAPRCLKAFDAPDMSADSAASRRLRRAYEKPGRHDPNRATVVTCCGLDCAPTSCLKSWTRRLPSTASSSISGDATCRPNVGRAVWKTTGRVALQLITTGRSLHQMFRPAESDEEEAINKQAELEEMPEDKEGVLDNHDGPASASLTFEPAAGATTLLPHSAELTDRRGAWHRPAVWFDMQPDQSRASVLLGTTVIGQAAVPVDIWTAMLTLASENLYADGIFDFRIHNDQLEIGTLVCTTPLTEPLLNPRRVCSRVADHRSCQATRLTDMPRSAR
jgi:hypothetical protein